MKLITLFLGALLAAAPCLAGNTASKSPDFGLTIERHNQMKELARCIVKHSGGGDSGGGNPGIYRPQNSPDFGDEGSVDDFFEVFVL